MYISKSGWGGGREGKGREGLREGVRDRRDGGVFLGVEAPHASVNTLTACGYEWGIPYGEGLLGFGTYFVGGILIVSASELVKCLVG